MGFFHDEMYRKRIFNTPAAPPPTRRQDKIVIVPADPRFTAAIAGLQRVSGRYRHRAFEQLMAVVLQLPRLRD
jgi:hypothetical protein